jgi:hypothetical protein
MALLTRAGYCQQENNSLPAIIPVQSIQFGAFTMVGSSGGTVSVATDGTRTSTGGIVLLTLAPIPQPAIFEIRLNQPNHIIVTATTNRTLISKSGAKLRMDAGPTDYGRDHMVIPVNAINKRSFIIRVGGTLQVPGSANPGLYHGEIEIGIHQE